MSDGKWAKFPMMVYRAPGPEMLHGLSVGLETASVSDEDDLAKAKDAGWSETTPEAVSAYEAKKVAEAEALRQAAANAASTSPKASRAELEVMAKELGIEFKTGTTDAALLKAIEAKQRG